MQFELCAFDLTHLSAVQMSIGLSNILRDMTQLSAVEEQGHCRVSQCESFLELRGC